MATNTKKFTWHSFDINAQLPVNWDEVIVEFALSNYHEKILTSTSVTSREASESERIAVQVVGGAKVRDGLPWLYDLYHSLFLDHGQSVCDEPLSCSNDVRYGINLNVQQGKGMRYECHVDSNPLEGLLYVTDHPNGTGGELVVANNPESRGVEQISENSEIVYPKKGHLIFFDARDSPHYVAPLRDAESYRIVAAMNFYTPSCTEADRPPDLNRHLGLE